MVPFGRGDGFVGRESIMCQILERIPPSRNEDDCQRTAIEGLGGVGKTRIALEAAFRVREQYPDCSVFWVPAMDITIFENAYRAIGRLLGVAGIDEDKADVKVLVKAALSREDAGRWLLIVDNADDMELLYGSICLSSYLPFSKNGSILFTTRSRKVAVRLAENHLTSLPLMETHEAQKLLEASVADKRIIRDMESTTRLLSLLTNLPLAIKQAAAYMNANQIPTTTYCRIYETSDESMISLLSKEFGDEGRYNNTKNPVATTWLISFEHISRDSQLAAIYLKFICFLAEKDIPVALLPKTDSELELAEAIGTLKAYAFITQREEQDVYDVHRLVRLSMLDWLAQKGERKEWATKALQRLADVFPFPEHENREVWLKYLPHAQTALNCGEDTADERAELDLLFNVAESYSVLGKYQEAEQMYRQVLELREKVLGRDHPFTIASMNNFACTLDNLGKYKEAEAMYQQVFELLEKVLGREHPFTIASIDNLGVVLGRLERLEEAETMHRQALELTEKVLGREHPSTLNSINNLGIVLESLERHKEAETILRQALELREKVLGNEHPSTLNSMNNLGIVLESLGRHKEAETILRQALELREKVLGNEHPSTLLSIGNLGIVLESLGRHKEAETMLRQALELREKVLGGDHPDTLSCKNNLVYFLRAMGEELSS
jgi:tetratricopeptide (TPR) repeat protein